MSAPPHVSCSASCVHGAPISWLELERYVLGESRRAAELEEHLAECLACGAILQRIRNDERTMPSLMIPVAQEAPRARRWSWRFAMTLAPAAILLMVLLARDRRSDDSGAGVKGSAPGFSLVRENASRLLRPTHFAEGDRFMAFVTCAPDGSRPTYVDLVVEQEGRLYYPIETATIECGNQVPVPGAFSLHGDIARVCLVIEEGRLPARQSIPPDAICLELLPASS